MTESPGPKEGSGAILHHDTQKWTGGQLAVGGKGSSLVVTRTSTGSTASCHTED